MKYSRWPRKLKGMAMPCEPTKGLTQLGQSVGSVHIVDARKCIFSTQRQINSRIMERLAISLTFRHLWEHFKCKQYMTTSQASCSSCLESIPCLVPVNCFQKRKHLAMRGNTRKWENDDFVAYFESKFEQAPPVIYDDNRRWFDDVETRLLSKALVAIHPCAYKLSAPWSRLLLVNCVLLQRKKHLATSECNAR